MTEEEKALLRGFLAWMAVQKDLLLLGDDPDGLKVQLNLPEEFDGLINNYALVRIRTRKEKGA